MVNTRSPELDFVQHNMNLLKQGGECGMVVPDGILSQSGAAQGIRENLFEDFNARTVLILPIGALQPYTNVAANVISFEKGDSTEKVWFYDLQTEVEKIERNNPLTEEHFEDFLENFNSRGESEHYFSVSVEEIERNKHILSYGQYKEFGDGDEVAPPEELFTELQSLQNTVRENTEAIMDKLEDE